MNVASALEALGLAHIEALSYAHLAANSPSTGYKVARGIGKPTANVYRALEALERKGLVVLDRGTPPMYRALSPDDMLTRLEHDFQERKAQAARELAALQRPGDDERVYALKSLEQVAARAHVLLASAQRIVLAEVPGDWSAHVLDAVDDTRSRRVRVVVLTDDRTGKVHDDTIRRAGRAATAIRFVADGREAVIASLPTETGGAGEAIWTRSPLVGRVLHEALAAEILYALVASGLEDGLSADEVETAFERARRIREIG